MIEHDGNKQQSKGWRTVESKPKDDWKIGRAPIYDYQSSRTVGTADRNIEYPFLKKYALDPRANSRNESFTRAAPSARYFDGVWPGRRRADAKLHAPNFSRERKNARDVCAFATGFRMARRRKLCATRAVLRRNSTPRRQWDLVCNNCRCFYPHAIKFQTLCIL